MTEPAASARTRGGQVPSLRVAGSETAWDKSWSRRKLKSHESCGCSRRDADSGVSARVAKRRASVEPRDRGVDLSHRASRRPSLTIMSPKPVTVLITGAAGQIGYALAPMVAAAHARP